jgi:2-polyprenyl-3-methyl-5-hydroxy-6-metoxy-1,4-benzoquinol methylase
MPLISECIVLVLEEDMPVQYKIDQKAIIKPVVEPGLEKDMEKLARESWDKIFKLNGKEYASSLNYLPELFMLFDQHRVKRIIDLGCGTGDHLLALAEQGFEVCGVDTSEEAMKIAASSFKEKGLTCDLRHTSMFEPLPLKDNSFDAVICFRALNHARIDGIRTAIREMERILTPRGIVFVTVPAPWPGRKRKVSMIERTSGDVIATQTNEPRTRIHLSGEEAGVIHFSFNKALLRKEFKHFGIFDLRIGDFKDLNSTRRVHYYTLIGGKKY